ncbi:hypothetical protein GF325_04215 [Candidatus Bathyarchaeota archaeon]|nr:hypothetical protein [Candidatus Bathyarchaeota archaeon]
MGLYEFKKDLLGQSFSFYDFCRICHFDETQTSKARNILKSWAQRGLIKRISRNVYEKIK